MQLKEIHDRFLLWRDAHIKERHFLLFICFLVGILTALAAWMLKTSIHFLQKTDKHSYCRVICQISGERRHQSWRDENTLLHFTA